MLPEAREHRFLLYSPTAVLAKINQSGNPFDFPLPSNFEIKILRWPLPFLWTQIRLAWEMFVRSPEILFIPVHVLPFFAPKNSIATIHGLEYEFWPQNYSFWRRFYLRWSTKSASSRVKKIIAISENTRQDLIKLYEVKAEKIYTVHHGISLHRPESAGRQADRPENLKNLSTDSSKAAMPRPYLLYIGRLETKKNIQGILEAYKILKERYKIPHELILAGMPGYGYRDLNLPAQNRPFFKNGLLVGDAEKPDIKELGYVDNDLKWRLLFNADIFLFPSFYEGFGLPVLEAQAAGVPVVTSFGSCLPEIAGQGALFINPQNSVQIAEAVRRLIDDKILRDRLIQLGYENAKKFNWEKCARETLKIVAGS